LPPAGILSRAPAAIKSSRTHFALNPIRFTVERERLIMPPKAAGIQPLSFTLFCSSIPSSFFHIHLLVDFYLLLSCLAAHCF
jgi:hypothetical protein